LKGYKVIMKQGNELISYIARDEAQVTYKPNEWVKAPRWLAKMGYHLTFFKNLRFAKKFLKENLINEKVKKNSEIWRCEVEDVLEILPPFRINVSGGWGESLKYNIPWPKGTFMAKEIKLIKKVIPKEEE